MYNFFVDENSVRDFGYEISGADFKHIVNVLRMNVGDSLLVSCNSKSDLCEIISINKDFLWVKVTLENYNNTELPIEITLFQGLPKSDKMEFIIQKTTELGVTKIVPVEMKRCVVKIEDKKKTNKIARWQSISESAAKQSKRNIIPKIENIISFKELLNKTKEYDLFIVPYESKYGMKSLNDTISLIKSGMKIGVLIGPEGGFEQSEIDNITAVGGKPVSLGKRILRTETAAIVSVASLMLLSELKLGGEEY